MSIQKKIVRRIRGKGRGSVFTPKDFLDLGSRAAIDQSLSRLTTQGTIRRIGRGVYDFPRTHPRLGRLAPRPVDVAKAVSGGANIQSSGAKAANDLGLTTQVPAQPVYVTDGPSRTIRLYSGRQVITLRHAGVRKRAGMGSPSGNVFQALRHLGKRGVDTRVTTHLRRTLPPVVKRDLKRQSDRDHWVVDWMRPVIDQIAADS